MKQAELFHWWLPPPAWKPKGKTYLSRNRMTQAEAEKLGALRPEPGSREVIDVAETPEEERALRERSNTAAVVRRPS